MTMNDVAAGGRGTSEAELDRVFDALAHTYRRAVIDELERDAPLALGELAERIADRDDGVSVKGVKLELVHRHLPRLDDAGVVAYDSSARLCDLDRACVVRSVLRSIDELD